MSKSKLIDKMGLQEADFEPNPAQQQIEKNRADLEYVAMMADIPLDDEEE